MQITSSVRQTQEIGQGEGEKGTKVVMWTCVLQAQSLQGILSRGSYNSGVKTCTGWM